MKITEMTVSNFCGVRYLSVKMHKQVLLVAGSNAAGKSSLQDAIRLALNADLGRVTLKKEVAALVRDGADSAAVDIVTADADDYRVLIDKGGKITDHAVGRQPCAVLPFLLNMQAFSRADGNARRQLLASITSTIPTTDLIIQRLHERGCESDKVEAVKPLLRAGIDAAAKDAARRATESKGAWRGVTGETYGEKKASDWKAAMPEVTPDADLAMNAALIDLDKLLDDNVRQLAMMEADLVAEGRNVVTRDTYRDAPAKLNRLENKLGVDERDLAAWQLKLEGAQAKASGVAKPVLFDCPCCNAKLYHRAPGADLLEWMEPDQVADTEAVARIPELERSVRLYQSAIVNDKRDIEATKLVLHTLNGLPPAKDVGAMQKAVAALQGSIQGIKADKKRIEADWRAHNDKVREKAQANTKTATAAGHHADACAWSKIAAALSPDGIPGELLAGALKPLNNRLRQSAEDSGWPQAAVDADMAITANGRPYALLSESEQWRVDAMLTEAASFLSGQGFMLLDRMDVLDPASRGEFMAWMEVLAENHEVGTVIVCATLKAPPAERDGVQVVWLDSGERVAMKEAA